MELEKVIALSIKEYLLKTEIFPLIIEPYHIFFNLLAENRRKWNAH